MTASHAGVTIAGGAVALLAGWYGSRADRVELGRWAGWVREADVLPADGGDALYRCHWMRQSGLVGLLPSLPGTVRVRVSAASMVMTARTGEGLVS